MKLLIILLTMAIVNKSCPQSKLNEDTISIEYTASSRGFFKHIVISHKHVKTTYKRDSELIKKTYSEKDWIKLIKEIKSIDIKNLPNLKAPSEDRFFDGAAIGNLKIIHNGQTYKTQSFDHGNPPKEITTLVKEILSITQNIE